MREKKLYMFYQRSKRFSNYVRLKYFIFQDNYIRETQIQQKITKMSREMVNQNFLKTEDSQMRYTTNLPPSSSELHKVIKSLQKMYQEQKEKREEIEKKIAMVQKRTLQRETELIRIIKKLKQDNNNIVQQAPQISKLFNKIWDCFDEFNQNTAEMIQQKYEDNYKSMERRVNVILQHFKQELAKKQQNGCRDLDEIQKQLRVLCETAIKIQDRNTQLLQKIKKQQFQAKILKQEKILILQDLNLKKIKVNSLTQQIRILKKLSSLQSPFDQDKKVNIKYAKKPQNDFIAQKTQKAQQIKRSHSKAVENKQIKQLLKHRSEIQPSALSTLDFYYKEIKGSKNDKEVTKIGSTISYTPRSSHNRSYTSQTNRNIKNSSLFVTNNKLNKNKKDLENYKISLRVSSVNNYDEDNNCISSSIKKEDIVNKLETNLCPNCKKQIPLSESNLKQDKLKEQQYISTISSLQKCLKRQKQKNFNLGNVVTRVSNKSQQVNEALQKIITDIQLESTTNEPNGASKKLDSILQSQKFFNMIKVLQQRLSMVEMPSVNCGWGEIWSETMPEL